jgi:hypothetical protein
MTLTSSATFFARGEKFSRSNKTNGTDRYSIGKILMDSSKRGFHNRIVAKGYLRNALLLIHL